jgi:site-specific DNA recombinase
VRDGRFAGGRAYGYRPIQGNPGEMVIVEDEAAIIRRIFGAYVSGHTPGTFAQALNRELIPPPRGRNWTSGTIVGNSKRGHGILQNEIYAGRIMWTACA